ncbi:hypothetical protein PYW07_007916 [Mythimna separata]|uniref:PKD/REJ-like domain-containing protein n=1 Tax=Mythimna separata TaxID=271217 RepID=A0AAD7YRR5_MYTSE|nr:hypothetical protein PYW07_007916 [Mythimna separata]
MILINIVLVCVTAVLVRHSVAEPPKFRILAPPFVCPKDKDSVIDKPDNTIITLQTEPGIPVEFLWVVRWQPLVESTQRFNLALWHTVRELEQKLNGPQMESTVFVINNTELLTGVKYIFNVTAKTYNDNVGTEKQFEIDNSKGDPKLLIEGQTDMFAIELVGGQLAYADIDFILEAEVTTCYRTHDYYFVWTVTSAEDNVAVSDVKGSRLFIRANTLTPGQAYDVLCQVYKFSNGDFITQNSLPFRVFHRGLSVHFNVNLLVVSIETPFKLHTDITKLDYIGEGMTIAWECTFEGEPVDTFYETDDEGTLSFPSGLAYVGEYLISLTVTVLGQSIADQATAQVTAQESRLPVIQMIQMNRILNEGSVVTVKANISDVVPGCTVIWYFRSQHCLESEFSTATDICDDNPHGSRISEPLNFNSLEENFLSELTDYTNETSWKSVSASMDARAGRVRVVVECHCLKENCTSEGEVYADVIFQLNDRPDVGYVLVTPEIGTAMETVFRLSTRPVVDTSRPLRYSFFVDLTNNDTLLLGSYLEHTAMETLLPYIEGGTFVSVEVCDSLGACTIGASSIVPIAPGVARTVEALLEDVRAHVRRCELLALRRLAACAIVTYTNTDQVEALSVFTTSLLNILGGIEERCIETNYDEYNEFLYWLQSAGIDTAKLM